MLSAVEAVGTEQYVVCSRGCGDRVACCLLYRLWGQSSESSALEALWGACVDQMSAVFLTANPKQHKLLDSKVR